MKFENLSTLDVERLKEKSLKNKGISNKDVVKNDKSYFKIIIDNLLTFYNLIFIMMGVIYLIVGVPFTNYLFLFIATANLFVAIFQEMKTKIKLKNLNIMNNKQSTVVRNGEEFIISSSDIYLGDLVKLSMGDEIPVDGKILGGYLEVNESILTGESKNVKKRDNDSVMAGSFVVSGTAYIRAEKVGSERFVSKLEKEAKNFKTPKSKLLKSIVLITKLLGMVVLPLGLIIFLMSSGTMSERVVETGAVIIGMIPAGMLLLSSVALASGILKLASKKTLVQDLYSIENLARVNMLCLDKTGTITDGTIKVSKVETLDSTVNVSEVIQNINFNSEGVNQTSLALIEKFGTVNSYILRDKVNFSSERKYSLTAFEEGGAFALGAPEFILKNMDSDMKKKILKYSSNGYRVLLLAKAEYYIDEDEVVELSEVVPSALIIMEDNIKDDAKETIKFFIKNGVQIKIISGDNANTVSSIAKKIGVPGHDKFISLDNMSTEDIKKAVSRFNIFGRVTPEQKSIIIRELKTLGYVVGMTGDGVNDILAMKQADCSIAMASGSSASKSVANLILLDSKFSSMPVAVFEGRRVINNIQRTSILYVMKGIFVMLLALASLFIGMPYPFAGFHFLLILEVFVEAYATTLLAVEPNSEPINGSFLKNVIMKAIPAALLLLTTVLIVGYNSGFNSGLMALTMNIASYAVLFKMCSPIKTKYRLFVFLSAFIIGILWSLLGGLTIGSMFIDLTGYNIWNLDLKSWIIVGITFITALPLYYTIEWIFRNIFNSKGLEEVLENIEEKDKVD